MARSLRLLLIEDCPDDAVLLIRELRRGGFQVESTRVATADRMEEALKTQSWDIVISDYVIPGFGGMEALELFRTHGSDIPFILISGQIGEELAVAALKAGADDYIMKDRMTRLVPAVDRALAEAQRRREHRLANEALRQSEERLRQLTDLLEKRVQERTADLRVANSNLQSQINERKRLESELLDIAENERRRIGFDLHDDIGQRLMGVSMLVKALESRLQQQEVPDVNIAHRVSSLLDDVINHTQDLADCFSSLDPADQDLGKVIRKLADNVSDTFGVHCEVKRLEPVPQLPPDVSAQIYKIAQESIGNAVKHGKAHNIKVIYGQWQNQFLLQVTNDGVPYQVSEDAGQQLGLRIMAYRAHTVGGTLGLRTNGNSGMVATCLVPLAGAPARTSDSSSTEPSFSLETVSSQKARPGQLAGLTAA